MIILQYILYFDFVLVSNINQSATEHHQIDYFDEGISTSEKTLYAELHIRLHYLLVSLKEILLDRINYSNNEKECYVNDFEKKVKFFMNLQKYIDNLNKIILKANEAYLIASNLHKKVIEVDQIETEIIMKFLNNGNEYQEYQINQAQEKHNLIYSIFNKASKNYLYIVLDAYRYLEILFQIIFAAREQAEMELAEFLAINEQFKHLYGKKT
ncbi:hypothetical protein EDEG_01703 [Edhazardia aedis USNM 41457]|uniref:Uncharacterized protein n=1 Tax=Edhazardia aedis (strain USNM 41457) TaxID=1003232 RepID=J9D929_EDHAE|nr:hypothetical protein EDEG_01703 [Edhazardia aedis USNM 41457]|eukprot:EJW04009.1 hypothetical protein EDEG_01703 [Edhazardia aedis USNM 41457]